MTDGYLTYRGLPLYFLSLVLSRQFQVLGVPVVLTEGEDFRHCIPHLCRIHIRSSSPEPVLLSCSSPTWRARLHLIGERAAHSIPV